MNSDICKKESAEVYSVDSFNTDVSIIGAGVAGLYSSYCCSLAGLDSVLIEALMFPGGQCATIYPEKKVYGTPGFKNIKARELFMMKLLIRSWSWARCKMSPNSLFSKKVTGSFISLTR